MESDAQLEKWKVSTLVIFLNLNFQEIPLLDSSEVSHMIKSELSAKMASYHAEMKKKAEDLVSETLVYAFFKVCTQSNLRIAEPLPTTTRDCIKALGKLSEGIFFVTF